MGGGGAETETFSGVTSKADGESHCVLWHVMEEGEKNSDRCQKQFIGGAAEVGGVVNGWDFDFAVAAWLYCTCIILNGNKRRQVSAPNSVGSSD